MRWIAVSQSTAVVAAGVVLPFYVLYLQEATRSYSLFAYLYATFTLAAALTHLWMGTIGRVMSVRAMLVVGNVVAGAVLLLVPSFAALWQLYLAQVVLGVAMSMQKSGEKIAVAAVVSPERRAQEIGSYHAVVALFTAAALFATGWLLDTLSLVFVFYAMGALLVLAGLLSTKVAVAR